MKPNNMVAQVIRILHSNMARYLLVHRINHQETPIRPKMEVMVKTITDHRHHIRLHHRNGITHRRFHRPIVHRLINANTQIIRITMEATRGNIPELQVISQTHNGHKITDMGLKATNKRRKLQLLITAICNALLKHLRALL